MVIKVYRRELIYANHLSFPEDIFYEDNCAGTIWMLTARHFELIEEPLYYYYQNPDSTVHVINRSKCENRKTAARLLAEGCKEHGFTETFHDEIEFRFTELFYSTTLFSYLSGIQGESHLQQLSYVGALAREMKATFPAFRETPYSRELMGKEEKELIDLQMKSNLLFYLKYKLMQTVRRIRK
ncbi:MAG: glycosyl transferase family 2, partial [Lachnospiraceae bacterium]|nr:glycosyl transferase family 2 [Lachnospiraceae bacterium]